MEDKYLKRSEAQQILRVSITKIFQMISSQELPAIKVGRSYRIKEADLKEYLQKQADKVKGDISK
jgi:excisionase family DNA binding protein